MTATQKFVLGSLLAVSLSFWSYSTTARTTASADQEAGQGSGATSVWSPNHQTLARLESAQLIGTPAGSNSCLYLNSRAVYPVVHPKNCEPRPKGIYDGIHAFLTLPEWSPDSRKVAVVARIFDWEYADPFGKYWEGTLSNDRYYLIVAVVDHPALGYPIHPSAGPRVPPDGPAFYSGPATPAFDLRWLSNSQISVDGSTFDLNAQPPAPVP